MKSDDILRRTQELLSKKAMEKDAEKTQLERDKAMLIKEVARDLSVTLRPVLEDLAQAQQITIESMRKLLSEIKVEVPRTEVVMPDIRIPRPEVNVTVPEVKVPTVNIPAPIVNFPDRMSVSMDSVDNKRPLPVQMMGSDGKPMSFSMGAGGGGKADFFNIKDIKTSTGASWFNDEGLRVSGSFSVTASNSSTQAIDSSGDAYTVANPFPVQVVSGGTATSGVNIVDSSGVGYSGSNPVPVTLVSGGTATTAVQNLNADGTYRDTFPVQGTVVVSSITNSTASALVDSSGVQYSGSNPVPVKNPDSSLFLARIQGISADGASPSQPVTVSSLDATTNTHNAMPGGPGESNRNALRVLMASDAIASVNVTGATGTLASNIVDSSGVAYSGSNPVPVTMVTSAVVSTIAVGSVVADAVDDGSAPVQFGGIARTANPTAVAANDVVKATFDDVGRQLVRPVQVRDLISTASVTLTTNNANDTTLMSGASNYFDLIQIIGANSSDGAVAVFVSDIHGGTAVAQLEIPANGTAGFVCAVPIPQSEAGNSWCVDWDANTRIADRRDVTNTNVKITALFSKEV